MAGKLFPITAGAGCERDGTEFASTHYIDTQWCRFQRGQPKKMGGYNQIYGAVADIPRGCIVTPNIIPPFVTPIFNVYWGDPGQLQYIQMGQDASVIGGPFNITPAALPASPNNLWTFDVMYDTLTAKQLLFFHAAPNLGAIDQITQTPVFYIDISTPAAVAQPLGESVAGGVISVHPFLFIYDIDGNIAWSDRERPTVFGSGLSGTASIASSKIVAAKQVRAGTSSPGALFWTLDSVIRATYNGVVADGVFTFDTVSDESSILSQNGVIEYDGKYFWAGIDRFLMYDGIVREVPNQMNFNWFFYRVDFTNRQKVWATKVPQFGEIWWHYPSVDSPNGECDEAIIYNIRENTWYDTTIARGCGYFAQVFKSPIWFSNNFNAPPYKIWQHETGKSYRNNGVFVSSGYDQNIDGALTAIQSFVETAPVSLPGIGPTGGSTGIDRWTDLYRLELDMNQAGDMTLIVNGREYARSDVQASAPYTFSPDDVKIDLREQRRIMTLRFESNTVGGFYEFGQNLCYDRIGDGRQ